MSVSSAPPTACSMSLSDEVYCWIDRRRSHRIVQVRAERHAHEAHARLVRVRASAPRTESGATEIMLSAGSSSCRRR